MSVYDLTGRRHPRAVRPSPIFLAFVGAFAAGGALAWTQHDPGSRAGDFGVFVMVLAGWVVTLSLHEFGHAYTAFRAGDRDVETAGYLTLNPFKYAHPLLSIVLPLLFIVQGGIGLPGGAVYLHPRAFRSRAMQSAAAAAGPLTNLAFGALLILVARSHLNDVAFYLSGAPSHARFWAGLAFLGFLQLTAAVLNLLPIPGLDGYAIIEPYLAPETVHGAEKIKPWGMIGVIVLLQIQQLNTWFFNFVYGLYDLFGAHRALSELGYLFFKFWQKVPF